MATKQPQQPQMTALQIANQQVAILKQRLEQKKDDIYLLVGDDKEAVRLMMAALMAAADDPKIRDCEPNSIVRAVVQAALCGADIAGGQGEGYLIPYRNKDLQVTECQFSPGYRLWQRRIQEATGMRVIADVVCEADHYLFSQLPLIVEHVRARGERGNPQCAYAALVAEDGRIMFAQEATLRDIEQARKSSRKGREYDSPAWRDWEDRMARKLPIMRLGKEARGWRPTVQLARLIEAEATFAAGSRPASTASLGDGGLPMPRLAAPQEPASLPAPKPGVHKIGRGKHSSAPNGAQGGGGAEPQPAAPQQPARQGESREDYGYDANGRDLEADKAPQQEPPHDPTTGEVVEQPAACAAPAQGKLGGW